MKKNPSRMFFFSFLFFDFPFFLPFFPKKEIFFVMLFPFWAKMISVSVLQQCYFNYETAISRWTKHSDFACRNLVTPLANYVILRNL